jgi:probable F420-dependent oxidoreductase
LTPRPFRFGCVIFNAASRQEWRSKACKVEDLGYSTFLVSDHLGLFPPLVGLAEAADATTTLRIGGYVFGNDFRHPVHLAREAAAIDFVSNGRLEFGLGTGFYINDYKLVGITLDSPAIRVSRFEEAIQVIKGLWTNESFTFKGSYYSVEGLECIPKPVQKPHPSFLLGGGSKRILSIAAREADIVSINVRTTAEGGLDISSLSPDATQEKVEWVRQAAGARFNDLELNMLIVFVAITDNRQSAAEQIAGNYRQIGLDVQAEQILASPSALIGSVDEIVNKLQERRERYGISYIAVFEDQLEAFAPVVARLTGT